MAKILFCGVWNNAKVTRIVSEKSAYAYQWLYYIKKCKGYITVKDGDTKTKIPCTAEHMQWKGEYQDGEHTELFDITKADHEHWLNRAEKAKARPEAQLMSEYTKKIAGEIMQQSEYLTKLCEAHKWYKGKRVE